MQYRYNHSAPLSYESLVRASLLDTLGQCPYIVNEWYNGCKFGDQTICNPWSVRNYIDEKAAVASSSQLLKLFES